MLRSGLRVGLFLWLCASSGAQATAPDADTVCATCHTQTNTYLHTAHHATSSEANPAVLEPLLQAAGSTLTVSAAPLPTLSFTMHMAQGQTLQTAETGWGPDKASASEPVDLVIGSNKRGQTFLYWAGDRLFELPVSYWREGHRWINSPGYLDGTADFQRPVQPGCLECHATFIQPLSSQATTNSYVRASLLPGIGCQTCHGPGLAHVAAEKAAALSGSKAPSSNILNPAKFSRDRQIDLCALCHSGIQRTALMPAYSYVPGEPLDKYFQRATGASAEGPDVHGNQVGLLQRSRCYAASASMSCSTCHDVHTTGQPVAAYAARCLTCHRWQSCGEAHKLGATIQTKCIQCHMPVQRTSAIVSETAGERVQASMRTHWIRVYAASETDTP